MKKEKKLLPAICLSGLLVIALGACDDSLVLDLGDTTDSDTSEDINPSTELDPVDDTIYVNGISLSDGSAHHLLEVDETLTLTATISPIDADNQNVVWTIESVVVEEDEDDGEDGEDEIEDYSITLYADDGVGDNDGGDDEDDDEEGDDEEGDDEDEPEPELEPDYTLENDSIELAAYGNVAVITGLGSGVNTVSATSEDGKYSVSTEINVVSSDEIITDYVVNFNLSEGVSVPSYGELWLAIDGADGLYALTLDEVSGCYSVHIGQEAVRETISYHIYLTYNDYYSELENCPQYTTELEAELLCGSAIISESYTEGDITDTIISVPDLPAPTGEYEEINIELTIYNDDGCHTPTVIPETIDVYLEWSSDSWVTTHEAYIDSDGLLTRVDGTDSTFTFTFTFPSEELVSSLGEIDYEIYYEVATEKGEIEGEDESEIEDENIDPSSEDLNEEDETAIKTAITHSFTGGSGSFTVPYFYDQSIIVSFCDYNKGARADDYYFGTDFYVLFVDTSGYSLESLVTKNDTSSSYDSLMYVVMSENESFISEDIIYGDTCIAYSGAFVSTDVSAYSSYDGNGCIYCDGSARHISGETDTFTMVFTSDTFLTFSTGEITIPEKSEDEKDLVYICPIDFSTGTQATGAWVEVDSYEGLHTAIEIEDDDPYMD